MNVQEIEDSRKIAKTDQKELAVSQKGKELTLTSIAVEFLGTVFGGAAENMGGLLSDQTKHWRAQNLDKLALLWKERIKERGISEAALKHLPFGDAFKVIDAASMEDDEDVQRMWADLIANATDPEKSTKIKKVYIDLLKSLSSPEVTLLNLLSVAEGKNRFASKDEIESYSQEINALADSSWRKFDKGIRDTAIQNLVRLRCIAFRPRPPAINNLFDIPRDMDRPWPAGYGLVNAEQFQQLMIYYEDIVLMTSGVIDHKPVASIPLHGVVMGMSSLSGLALDIPEMNYILTPMARDLLGACRAEEKDDREEINKFK